MTDPANARLPTGSLGPLDAVRSSDGRGQARLVQRPGAGRAGGYLSLAALHLVAGLGLVPRRGAVVRVAAITVSYLVVVAGIDRLTGGD